MNNKVLGLLLIVLALCACWTVGSETPRELQVARKRRGRCRNRSKCLRKCPSGLKPDFIWFCLKPEYCVNRDKGKCFYNSKFQCRRRALDEIVKPESRTSRVLPSTQEKELVKPRLRRNTQQENTGPLITSRRRTVDVCPLEITLPSFGITCLDQRWSGFCRVGNSKGEYYRVNKVSYDECKARCHMDINCEAIEYQWRNEICEIHLVKPTQTASSSSTTCLVKSGNNYNCFPFDFRKVADGWCRDDSNSQGLYTLYPRIGDLQECESLCWNSPGCLGFEWQEGRKKCEIHFREINTFYTKAVTSGAKPHCYRKVN